MKSHHLISYLSKRGALILWDELQVFKQRLISDSKQSNFLPQNRQQENQTNLLNYLISTNSP